MGQKYKVIQDTREQTPWHFAASVCCFGTEVGTLSTGDYTLEGYEEIFVIERKGNISEWAKNIIDPRFVRELERLKDFVHSFVILEFDMADLMNYPYSSNIPKYLWKSVKVRPDLILKKTLEFQCKYPTQIIFAGKHGKKVASSIFKRMVEQYGKDR